MSSAGDVRLFKSDVRGVGINLRGGDPEVAVNHETGSDAEDEQEDQDQPPGCPSPPTTVEAHRLIMAAECLLSSGFRAITSASPAPHAGPSRRRVDSMRSSPAVA